jgi:CAAX prenyl protease-like protein
MSATSPPVEQKTPPRGWLRDDIAYILPMFVFLAFTQIGASWKQWYPLTYVTKTVLTALLLALCWRYYTKISWRYWWLGVIVGVIGIVQWVGMQSFLERHVSLFKPSTEFFNPFAEGTFSSPAVAWAFVAVRIMGAVLVVPVMEELFWRDFLWRQIIAPNDFKLAHVGEFEWAPFLIVPAVFAFVHGNWWLTSVVWALMIGGLLVYTKSLGACIVAHAVTNLLLAAYVLKNHAWTYW